jgi:hypothetical protein
MIRNTFMQGCHNRHHHHWHDWSTHMTRDVNGYQDVELYQNAKSVIHISVHSMHVRISGRVRR